MPHIQLSGDYLAIVVVVFGTTISPYLFFWQAAEEVEDEKKDPKAESLLEDAVLPRPPPNSADRLL